MSFAGLVGRKNRGGAGGAVVGIILLLSILILVHSHVALLDSLLAV